MAWPAVQQPGGKNIDGHTYHDQKRLFLMWRTDMSEWTWCNGAWVGCVLHHRRQSQSQRTLTVLFKKNSGTPNSQMRESDLPKKQSDNCTTLKDATSCKYLGIILRSDLSWADQVNCMVKKAWKAPHFTVWILKKGNNNTKSLVYMSFVRPILEYGAACWDPYREGQISALDRVQKKAAKFAHHTISPNWDTLASRRKLSSIYALFKAYSGEPAWKAIGDRLQRPHYLSRVDHERKIWSRRQRTDIGKYCFVNRTIQHGNQLLAEVLGTLPCKPSTFKHRVRKVITELN